MDKKLKTLLNKAQKGGILTRDEMIFLLGLHREEDIHALFRTARELRQKHFGNNVLLYGFLYISTYCRNNCNFCFYRAANPVSPRYRKTESEIIESAVRLAQSGVHLIDLTLGEDPVFTNPSQKPSPVSCQPPGYGKLTKYPVGYKKFFGGPGGDFSKKPHGRRRHQIMSDIVKKVKAAVQLPVMVSPGVISEGEMAELAEAGADWYACYQETHNRRLFEKLRPGQDYDTRLNTKRIAHRNGLSVEEGILVGVGETSADIVESLEAMRELSADQVRAMNFVPQENTPMGNDPPPEPFKELLIIALMRLVFPGKLIPASLDVEGLAGLKRRLEAGANVVTSIVPPQQGLAGVARSFLDIDEARRTVASVIPVLEECGLQSAPHHTGHVFSREDKK